MYTMILQFPSDTLTTALRPTKDEALKLAEEIIDGQQEEINSIILAEIVCEYKHRIRRVLVPRKAVNVL